MTVLCVHQIAWALSMEKLGEEVLKSAYTELKAPFTDTNIACLTNAGYVKYRGQSTRMLYDVFSEKAGISHGKANLLPVHASPEDALWFAFVRKNSAKELLMVYVSLDEQGIHATEAINIYADKHWSFKPVEDVVGGKAFSIITIANGWAGDIPKDMIYGSLFHDHFCCGVATGYFTVRFIQRHIPLRNAEKYTYIGAPAWCQDDYIINYLNLTPGKHGYYAMQYPWNRPWKTSEQSYDKLGGIIIAFDHIAGKGKAYLLRFDWREDDFRKFVGEPGLKLDWKDQPWLHVWYNKFFFKNSERIEDFVSVLKDRELRSKEDFNRMVGLGANPLQEILGEDKTWTGEFK